MAAKLVISGYMANPAGTDSPYEYLQVIATQAIDFAATPYTVVWANNGTAIANGWVSGAALTYGFSINSGSLAAGQVAYLGGSGKLINGIGTTDISAANWLKTINTGTTAGDGFGTAATGGPLGNGGANADGIAIFDVPVASITNTTVPIDAVFFGTSVGTANPATGGYVLPTNDIYNNAQGTFGDGTNTTLFPDPAGGAFTKLTGTYNAVTGTWTTPRTATTVTNPTALTDIVAAVTIATTNPLPDLTITSSAPATATVNTPFNYTLTLANSGTAAATVVRANFTLPAGVTYNSALGTGFTATQAAGVVTFTGGTIAAGGSIPLTVNVTRTTAGTVTSAVGAAVADPAPGTIAESNETNNSSTTAVTTTVTAIANTPPTIAPSAASTFLTVPSLSGVINDPTDPAKNFGVNFTLADAETAVGSLTLTATSSNTAVVPNANLTISGTGASRNLKINPAGVGFADLTVTVSDGTNTTSTVLKYAASAASGTPTTSRFLTGTSDASTAIAIDSNYMLVGDDEDQTIRLYDRTNSGLPVKTFDFTNSLGLTDISGGAPREVDIEASTRVGNRIYWLGSQSNASGGNLRPNRYRLFATDISGSGATTNLTFAGKYDNLRTDLIAWGNTNGFNFTASAAAGKIPEATTLDGFNIEGLTIAPNGTTGYVAFRAPQVPASDRTKALIAPITNFADLVTGKATSATIGAPIQLDLGGRGIRSIDRNANNQYLIVAGPADGATGTAPKDFRLYTWTGNAADAPQVRSANLTALNAGGSFESIVEVPSNLTDSSQIQLLVDNGDNVWYSDNVISKELPQDNFQKFRSDIVTLGASPVRIRNIQGASHTSPLATQTVSNVPGVVTALIATGSSRGFYMQDPTADTGANPNSTSEAVFVFLGSSTIPNPTVGQSVQVTGRVDEFRPANNATNLTLTQINATVAGAAVGAIASLGTITPTIIGTGGRIQPTTSIQNDFTATGNVETGGDFDPTTEGIDFYESLESMLVQVNNPVVVGPTNEFGEFYVLPDNGVNATGRTSRGGIAVSATDFNPERIQIDDTLLNPPTNGSLSPVTNVADKLSTVSGIIGYSFSNYELLNTAQIPQSSITSGGLTKEVTNLTGTASQLTVATFNLENLDPSDTAKFPALASRIVTNLKSPDIINVEEIQDNNGATNDGVVAADTTYNTLISAIKTAGGPTYEFRQINPVNNQDGGEPGGNIRVGFLFNPSRVSFVDRPGGTSTTATTVNTVSGAPALSASPGRIDPTNAAFNTSRKPLVGEFVFNGQSVFVIANHFNSKGGDQPLFGPNQPPVLSSETQRLQQAQIVNNFVDSILAVDANANVIVAGDLNDFAFSEPLNVVRGIPGGSGTAVLQNLIETLPENERYTYNFQGNAQVLDHILASNNLAKNLAGFDVVHINSEFAQQDSDHDPSVARFNLVLPTVTITATDAAAAEAAANPGTFRITRSGSTALPLTVNYTTASGTGFATSNDYTPNLTGSIIIPAGQSFADVTITPIDDSLVEDSEAVKLTLVGAAAYNLGAAGTETASVAIADNDVSAPGTFDFSSGTYTVNENGTTQTITVNRTGGNNVSASVSYATANGSATAGNDYTATSGTLNFLSGETSKTFSIAIANDTLVEGNETVNLSLTNATNNASFGNQKTAILTIVDTTATPTPTPTPTGAGTGAPPLQTPTPTPTPTADPSCIADRIERPNLDRPNPVDNIINGSSGIFIGTPKNDGYVGTNNPNIFDGKAGNDNLIGGNSADILNGNEGNDFINGDKGDDILLGGKGNDIIIGGFGKDVIFGNQGNDSLNGQEDDDLILGNEGNDFIDGGKGNDTLFGGNGQDLILSSEGNDTLFGELGDDTLSGDAGNDLVYGGQGNDLIDGGKGNDSIYGDKGNDTLLGCEGNDILFGGLGNDSLIGGLGNDIFVVGNSLGLDIISDFVKGQDVLGLSGGLSFNQLEISQSNNNALIKVNGIAIASLTGVNASLIGVNDFRTI